MNTEDNTNMVKFLKAYIDKQLSNLNKDELTVLNYEYDSLLERIDKAVVNEDMDEMIDISELVNKLVASKYLKK